MLHELFANIVQIVSIETPRLITWQIPEEKTSSFLAIIHQKISKNLLKNCTPNLVQFYSVISLTMNYFIMAKILKH